MEHLVPRRISGIFYTLALSGFMFFSALLSAAHAQPLTSSVNWQDMRHKFSQMSHEKRLAVLIATNARAENRHTIAVQQAYAITSKTDTKREVKHFLEKTKMLRELSHYTEHTDLRRAFTAEIRAIRAYLSGDITRTELSIRRDATNQQIKKTIMAIKDKISFLHTLKQSQSDIILLGDTVYIIAKTRTSFRAAKL